VKLTGSLDNPIAKWPLGEIEKGNEILLEITPRYFSPGGVQCQQDNIEIHKIH
jgi:hypothetical protein